MEIKDLIDSAEIRYRKELENFFTSVWGETRLYSHDIHHHRRVWQYAKEILSLYSESDDEAYRVEPEKLLIASYIHDLGMVSEPGFKHGSASGELCRRFLEDRNFSPEGFDDVLDAIEHHDEKDYTQNVHGNNSILKILAAADDLDAFGYAGIYRYLEIYITRGISPGNIGHEIRKNAGARFRNFAACFRKYSAFYCKHRERYNILDSFMSEYNMHLERSLIIDKGENLQHQIVNMIYRMVNGKINPSGINELCGETAISPGIRDFFDRLYNELNHNQ